MSYQAVPQSEMQLHAGHSGEAQSSPAKADHSRSTEGSEKAQLDPTRIEYSPSRHEFDSVQSSPMKAEYHPATNDTAYDASTQLDFDRELFGLRQSDEHLKYKIRKLRLILRAITFLVAILVLIPITMTLIKFLATRDIQRTYVTASGQSVKRGPWAKHSKTWPTYMYFSIALVSVILDGAVLLGYMWSIKTANLMNQIATSFTIVIVATHVIMWVVGVVLYRTEKGLHGKDNDLWAWACSNAANEIQKLFEGDIKFGTYCNVQTYAWGAGLVQAAGAILSAFVFYLAYSRRDSKRMVKKRETLVLQNAA